MSLPLLLGIVATDKSQVDNEGAIRGGGWEQKRRAVASLQTRKRVVASFEDRDCGQSMVLYMPGALRSVRSKLWPLSNQLKRSSQNLRAVPLSFAQLAIGCSNPSLRRLDFPSDTNSKVILVTGRKGSI